MTLHHVPDVPALFRRFAGHLRAGGWVALADLDQEDGSFHEDAAGVHHRGFSREQIQSWLVAAGFQEVCLETATLVRQEDRDYPVFLATARRGSPHIP
jgi:putative AdoMet-dependent methyltransferase